MLMIVLLNKHNYCHRHILKQFEIIKKKFSFGIYKESQDNRKQNRMCDIPSRWLSATTILNRRSIGDRSAI